MEIAGLVLLGIGTAYRAVYGGMKLYWTWQDRRDMRAESESRLISDPGASGTQRAEFSSHDYGE